MAIRGAAYEFELCIENHMTTIFFFISILFPFLLPFHFIFCTPFLISKKSAHPMYLRSHRNANESMLDVFLLLLLMIMIMMMMIIKLAFFRCLRPLWCVLSASTQLNSIRLGLLSIIFMHSDCMRIQQGIHFQLNWSIHLQRRWKCTPIHTFVGKHKNICLCLQCKVFSRLIQSAHIEQLRQRNILNFREVFM